MKRVQREQMLNALRKEISECYETYKKKRKSYENKVRLFNLMLSILPIMITVIVILGAVFPVYVQIFNGIGLFFSIMFIIISYAAKNSSFDTKLIQRGTTYFALCNLSRRIRLEMNPEEKYEEYAKEFQTIMEHENEISYMNSLELAYLFKTYYQKGLECEQSLKSKEKNE